MNIIQNHSSRKYIVSSSSYIPFPRTSGSISRAKTFSEQAGFRVNQIACKLCVSKINPLNPELNPICYLLALLGAHHFLHVSRIRVKLHWSTKFHFLRLAETKCANSDVNWGAEQENHNKNASLATVFELLSLACTTS